MSSSGRIRVLLDSTYLLPVVGVDVEGVEGVVALLRRLRREGRLECYYTEFNLLEIIGKLSKIEYDEERVREGLSSIEEGFKRAYLGSEGWLKALELKKRGHRDLIDLLLYVASLTNGLAFLTRDDRLVEFLEEVGEDTGNVIREREFVRRFT